MGIKLFKWACGAAIALLLLVPFFEAAGGTGLQSIDGEDFYCHPVLKGSPLDRPAGTTNSGHKILRPGKEKCATAGRPVGADNQDCLCFRVADRSLWRKHSGLVLNCFVQFDFGRCGQAIQTYIPGLTR